MAPLILTPFSLETSHRKLEMSVYFSGFRILNCHAFDSAEMKIGQMKKVPLGLWEVEQITGHIVRESINFFTLQIFFLSFSLWALQHQKNQPQKEQQISQTYQAFLRGSETCQEILHANISKPNFLLLFLHNRVS